MTQTLEIPVFPLGTVLYPAGRLALRVFEPRYLAMTRACIGDDAPFGVCLIRAGFEVGVPAIPCEVGCTARILDWRETGDERFTLVAGGETVFRILERRTREDGLIVARVALREPADPTPPPDGEAWLVELLRKLMAELGLQHFPQPHRFEDASWVAYRLAELLPVTPERKQALLEIDDPLALLARVAALLPSRG